MSKEQEMFVSPSKGELELHQVVTEIKDFMEADLDNDYLIVIGSDSQAKNIKGHQEIDFVTAVIAHRVGRGAIYFLKKERQHRVPSLREKITAETLMSVKTALEIVPLLCEKPSSAVYSLEIHIDVGENGPTRELIKDAVGMVNGNGFKAKTKPESWGASSVADRHT